MKPVSLAENLQAGAPVSALTVSNTDESADGWSLVDDLKPRTGDFRVVIPDLLLHSVMLVDGQPAAPGLSPDLEAALVARKAADIGVGKSTLVEAPLPGENGRDGCALRPPH